MIRAFKKVFKKFCKDLREGKLPNIKTQDEAATYVGLQKLKDDLLEIEIYEKEQFSTFIKGFREEVRKINDVMQGKTNTLREKLDEINSSKNLFTQDQIAKLKEDNEYYYYACLLILKILGKLMGKDDGILLQTLLNADISSFLKPLILTNDLRTIKHVSFCFSNICSGTYGQVGYLFNNNALYELIKVGKNIYEAMELSK